MKKTILFLFSLMLMYSLFACTNDGEQSEENQNDDKKEEQVDYGTMTIEDMTIYSNFPSKPVVKFSNMEYAVEVSEIAFDYEGNDISFDGEYFEVENINRTIIVYAQTEHHTAEFTITTKDYVTACKDQSNANFYLNKVQQKEQKWINSGSPLNGTIFIGDSFFDTEFWSNYYTLYEGNNAFTNGISSSTTTDWEIWVGRLLYPMNPQNIVMHCGTNNLYDDRESAQTTIANTQRLLNTIHYHLPETKIYYFAIEPRTYGIGGTEYYPTTHNTIKTVNTAMKDYCEQNDFMVYLDVTENCFITEGVVDGSFFRDGVHPTVDNYLVYANALKDAGLDLTLNPTITNPPRETTTSLTFTSDMNVGASKSIKENGNVLVKEFSIKGNILVSQIINNAHIQFSVDGTHLNRFLLWDNDNNGSLYAGYAVDGGHTSNASTKGVLLNVKISFELVVTVNNAYLYINNQLVMVFVSANATSTLIGTEGCAVEFTDLVITSKSANQSGYNSIVSRTEILGYENSTNTTKGVVVL